MLCVPLGMPMSKKPRDTTRVNPLHVRNERLGVDVTVSMLVLHKGTCPDATVDNPHDKGTKPESCRACYQVA